ncbi:MAG: tetratricopeptide repeat protein [Armatimonadota bacterium]
MNYLPWRLTLLGSLCAVSHGGTISITRFRSQKTASLLAFLTSHPRTRHAREELVERFWPETDIAAGQNSLRVALAALRRELEPSPLAGGSVLLTDRLTVGFAPRTVDCDVVAFDAAISRANLASRDDGDIRADALEDAVALYTGPLLPGFYDPWICDERARLEAAFIDALERLADYYEARKDIRRALEFARRLEGEQEIDPDDPNFGRVDRLTLLAGQSEAAIAEAASRPHLPRPLDRFIGREENIKALSEILLGEAGSVRLVTLTGPGGTGKTRLALETAAGLQRKFGVDNIAFVPLVEIRNPDRILEAIREALRLPPSATAAHSDEEVESALRSQILQRLNTSKTTDGSTTPFLLILDNFEQLAERNAAASNVLERLLRGSSRLICLVTSRRRVGVRGERLFAVPPLAVPDTGAVQRDWQALGHIASVELFLERSRSASPDFRLTAANATAIAELCTRLEGLPLAIELSAAWSGSLSPSTMLVRLKERFALLSSVRSQDKMNRHRSLWATIAWSFDLLPLDLQQFWLRLSVFRGGWSAESAAAVCLETVTSPKGVEVYEILARLRERSLIQTIEEGTSGEIRFTLLESLREWAESQLEDASSGVVSQRHALYFAQQSEAARNELRGTQEKYWLDRFETDHDNFRAACDFYYSQGHWDESAVRDGLSFVGVLSLFWRKRGYLRDSRQQTDRFLSLPLSLAIPLERAKALNSVGLTAWMQNDLDAAVAYYDESLALFQNLGDTVGIGKVLSNLSLIAMERNDYPQAIALTEESLALHRSTGDSLSEAICLGNLANAYLETDDYKKGGEYHDSALSIYRELGDNEGIAIALSGFAYAATQAGERDKARRLYYEALQLRHELNDVWRICFSLASIADLLIQEGEVETAALLFGAVEALRQEIGAPVSDMRQTEFQVSRAKIVAITGEQKFGKLFAKGKHLCREDTVELALKSCLPDGAARETFG